MFKSEIIADSICPRGHRITTFKVVFPRFILAEINTHRMFSRNSASSRAKPFKTMLKEVQENPFIPIAFQKSHKGMQGVEYHNSNELCDIESFLEDIRNLLGTNHIFPVLSYLSNLTGLEMTRKDWWLFARDRAIECACIMYVFDVTKQLCNRLLEPFMWHTALISATEMENFFALRCPQYTYIDNYKQSFEFRSRKDIQNFAIARTPLIKDEDFSTENWNNNIEIGNRDLSDNTDNLFWLKKTKSGAEIHCQRIAELMWDSYNESTPNLLEEGEWHIPYGDLINKDKLEFFRKIGDDEGNITPSISDLKIKIATARCARLSYETLGKDKKIDYKADLELYDKLSKNGHWSPFEHCARVMTEAQYKGELTDIKFIGSDLYGNAEFEYGWCGNFRGFIQYRKMFSNENITK